MRPAYALSKPENQDRPQSWRDVWPVHPAAELFPLIGKDELRELADDIANNGQIEPIVIYKNSVLDGRNRLDALALIGRGLHRVHIHYLPDDDPGFDPVAYVISKNVHRRHLTADQKRDLISKLLKVSPETSNLQIAKQVKADDETVAKVRTKMEATSEIPKLKKTKGKDGKLRPAHKKRATEKVGRSSPPSGIGTTAPTPDPFAVSAKALSELKYACGQWLPKMVPEHRSEAAKFVAGLVSS